MGRFLPVALALAMLPACAPGSEENGTPDARDARDGTADGACDRASCESRCVAAGYVSGVCRTNGSCACAGAGCSDTECASRCRTAGYDDGACRDTGACGCSSADGGTPSSTGERCGDGIDNNGNGAVDEGCGCTIGTTQPCTSGTAESRNVGACRDGTQPCVGEGQFAHWGPCEGEQLPRTETCNGLDDDCDIATDEDCPGSCVQDEFGGEWSCDDGRDNDCDGVADCFDPDCPPCCTAELCDDGIDNNCDGQTDEYCDSPCAPNESGTPGACADGLDNDCDGRLDCLDLECLPYCCGAEVCGDGVDNDCDGRTDCADASCCTDASCRGTPVCSGQCCVPGTWRYCDTPTYCSWGRQDCRPDGRWGTCDETTRPSSCSGYFYTAACCLTLGACCQNYGRYEPSLPSDASIGSCDGIIAACE
jgi:hypothetical protein